MYKHNLILPKFTCTTCHIKQKMPPKNSNCLWMVMIVKLPNENDHNWSSLSYEWQTTSNTICKSNNLHNKLCLLYWLSYEDAIDMVEHWSRHQNLELSHLTRWSCENMVGFQLYCSGHWNSSMGVVVNGVINICMGSKKWSAQRISTLWTI